MMKQYLLILHHESQTLLLGSKLADICKSKKSCVIYLDGYIGTGKSTLCKGFLQSLGYKNYIKSPTYTLVESYFLFNKNIYHIDLYRLNSRRDLMDIGIQDYFNNRSILLVEWSIRGGDFIPVPDIFISINYDIYEQSRQIILKPCSNLGQKIVLVLLETD